MAEATASLEDELKQQQVYAVAKVIIGLGVVGLILIFSPFDMGTMVSLLFPLALLVALIMGGGMAVSGVLRLTRDEAFAGLVKKKVQKLREGAATTEKPHAGDVDGE